MENNLDLKSLLQMGVQLHRSGRLDEAWRIYKRVIEYDPENADALHLIGFIHYQRGEYESASKLIRQAIEIYPQSPTYHNNLGLTLKEQGNTTEALSCFKRALALKPDLTEALNNLGLAYQELGEPGEALSCYKKALETNPALPEAYNNMGNIFREEGKMDEAIFCYKRAITANPDYIEAEINLGASFMDIGMLDEASACFDRVIKIDPSHAGAYNYIGNILRYQGRFDEAISSFRKALELEPDSEEILNNTGNTLLDIGLSSDALSCFEKILKLNPNRPEVYAKMGLACKNLGDYNKAIAYYGKSLEIKPDFAAAYNNMGSVFQDRAMLDDAIASYRKAIKFDPDFVDAYFNLGAALQMAGRYDEGARLYQKALELDPDYARAKWLLYLSLPILYKNSEEILYYRKKFSEGLEKLIETTRLDTPEQKRSALTGIGTATNFYLQYQGLDDLALQKKYGDFVCRVMAANYPEWSQPLKMPSLGQNEKIRLGYVSSYMKNHTVGVFLMGWLKYAAGNNFEIYCYHISGESDNLTQKFREVSDHYCRIPGNIEKMANRIISDNLHILVFTDIGMYAPATQLAGLRLAPVQCKGWGHPVTTGLPTIDYYLSSDLMETDDSDNYYSEKLVRLPNIALVYEKPDIPAAPKKRTDFGIRENAFVYLSSQSLFKYLPQYDFIYPEIAKNVPNAQFVFLSNSSDIVTGKMKARLASSFGEYGLDMERFCLFQPRLQFKDFLSLNLASDVILDTFSWSGGKTTLEGISCGLPVVTCPGKFMRGRHAYAMLKMIGVDETIAEDENDYIAVASKLANDREWFLEIRELMKNKRNKLYNDATFIRGLEDFYRNIVFTRRCP